MTFAAVFSRIRCLHDFFFFSFSFLFFSSSPTHPLRTHATAADMYKLVIHTYVQRYLPYPQHHLISADLVMDLSFSAGTPYVCISP
jgi:hypothetical protein